MRIPFVQDYWIGWTYVHREGERGGSFDLPLGIEFRALDKNDIAEIARSSDPQMQRRQALPSEYVTRYGAFVDGTVAGVCTFAFGKSYRGYFPLQANEAELTDVFIADRFRGKGIAAALIRYGTEGMHAAGHSLLYAKIWRNNYPSLHAFAKAGWRRHCFFVRMQPSGTSRCFYAQWPPYRKVS